MLSQTPQTVWGVFVFAIVPGRGIMTISIMKSLGWAKKDEDGFTVVELLMAIFVFTIVVVGLSNAYIALKKSYTTARQLNEIYTVLSACPEIDRALEFNLLSNTSNCYPNNSFRAENNRNATITYQPTLTVTNTSALPVTDPLQAAPDSKVLNISVDYPNSNAPPLQLRMLITRNGVGQL